MIESLTKVGLFLVQHSDLIEDIVDVLSNGGDSKELLRKAIRQVKVQVSDAAMKEELGL